MACKNYLLDWHTVIGFRRKPFYSSSAEPCYKWSKTWKGINGRRAVNNLNWGESKAAGGACSNIISIISIVHKYFKYCKYSGRRRLWHLYSFVLIFVPPLHCSRLEWRWVGSITIRLSRISKRILKKLVVYLVKGRIDRPRSMFTKFDKIFQAQSFNAEYFSTEQNWESEFSQLGWLDDFESWNKATWCILLPQS